MLEPSGEMPSLPRRLGIRLFAALGRRLASRPITDPTSGFTLVRRRVLPFLIEHTPRDFPDLNVLIALDRAGYQLREVPVGARARRTGQSMNRASRSSTSPRCSGTWAARCGSRARRRPPPPERRRAEPSGGGPRGRRGADTLACCSSIRPRSNVEPWYDTPRFGRHGLACLAGYLRQFDGFAVDVLDAKLERLGVAEIVDHVAALRPDVVGLTAFTNEIKPAARVAGAIRARWPSIVTVIGGVHATALPTRTLEEFPEFDLAHRRGESRQSSPSRSAQARAL
jgi:hypothetical protein